MITTKNQAIQFLTTMQQLFPFVHPEDDLTQIEPPFTDEQAKYLTNCFDQCYEVLPDPCGTILNEIRPKMQMFNPKN
jgi:hypothetical protein